MSFRKSAPAVLIAAVIVVIAAVTFISDRLFSGLTASIEDSQFQLMQSILDSGLNKAGDEALARAEIVAMLPTTKQLVAAQDRQKLLAEYAEMFAAQKQRRGIDQAQFHVPPAVSLLRLHNPTSFGDDLSRFRPIVAAVNRDQTPRKGYAIANAGPAIFGVAPVSDAQGKHVGSFEMGLEFGPLLDSLKAAYGLDFSLYIEEKPLREFARSINPAVLSDQNRVGRFIRVHSTNAGLLKTLAADEDLSGAKESAKYTRDAQGQPYGVLLVPLRDGAGEQLGVIAVARDFSGSRAAAGRSLVWQICLGIFAVIILSGMIIVVIRGFLLRPVDVLDQRLTALTAGERTAMLEPTDKFPAEIQSLAEHVARLQTERAA